MAKAKTVTKKKALAIDAPYTQSDSKEQAELIKLAMAARERQALVSTSITSQGQKECPRLKLVKQFVGEDALHGPNGEDPKVYAFFIENTRQELLKHASAGSVPVNYEGQPITTEGGDQLMVKPYSYYKQSLVDAKLESNMRMQAKSEFEDSDANMQETRKAGFEEETEIVQGVTKDQIKEALAGS